MPYLAPYTGSWTSIEARHLLRRTTCGPSDSMVDTAVQNGLSATLNALFANNPLPAPPLKYQPDGTGPNAIDDPGATFGNTWVNADPFPNVNPPIVRNRVIRSRSKSLYAWTFQQMHDSGISIREKLTLFWHNHFVVGQGVIPHREYLYYNLLREYALGNFKELTKRVTLDTGMLIYLSGTENTNRAPNENYSRELLELFTVGKGDLVGPGDYTHYTEDDVIEMAKALTGWRVLPVTDPDTLTAQFSANRHETGNKQLSHRFNNTVISNNGDQEYADLIDIIFQQDECSRFITKKLYRWFISAKIDQDIEDNVIAPLASIIRTNNYEIVPALRVLFASEHFFNMTACMIKNPVDLIMSASRGLDVVPSATDIEESYEYTYLLYALCGELEQELFQHPDVAGWKAYYQEPQFDKVWINNLLLPKRLEFCKGIVLGATFSINDENYRIPPLVPVLDIVANIQQASDPGALVDALVERLFNYPITASQRDALKDILTPGLPDFEWTLEYGDYLLNPNDVNMRQAVENKLRDLFSVMVQMSEFQIM